MYERYYRLDRAPFDIAPNPEFLFATPSHSEALATIAYGIEKRKGFIVLSGEVGLGKTTLLRAYLDQVDRAGLDLAYVLHPAIEFKDLLVVIGDEIGLALSSEQSLFELIDSIQQRLVERYRAGRNMAIIVDEAQRLPDATLENLRLLSNLETEHDKLIQIVLVGQPELDDMLSRNDMRQIAQRVALRARLKPLDVADSVAYLQHRLRLAGAKYPEKVMSAAAMRRLAQESGGVPRVLNILADNTMITGFALQRMPIPPAVVDEVVSEYRGTPTRKRRSIASWLLPATALAVVAGLAAMVVLNPGVLERVRNLATAPAIFATSPDSPKAVIPVAPAPGSAADAPSGSVQTTEGATSRAPAGVLAPKIEAVPLAPPPPAAQPEPAPPAPAQAPEPEPAPQAQPQSAAPQPPAGEPQRLETMNLPPIVPQADATLKQPVFNDPAFGAMSPAPVQLPNSENLTTPGTRYVVKPGDTLYRLVLDHYGVWDWRMRNLVVENNPGLVNDNVLWIGQVLILPDLPDESGSVAAATKVGAQ